MADHIHEWRAWSYRRGHVGAHCHQRNCNEQLTRDDVSRRLNATERLSAEDAKEQARLLELEGNTATAEMFLAYASALEGE